MWYPIELKEKATRLRKKGYSLKDVATELGISKSTSSYWLREVELPLQAQRQLQERKILKQYKARQVQIRKGVVKQQERVRLASKWLSKIKSSPNLLKLNCALIYWCEGNKSTGSVRFTNSDPTLINFFLSFLRKGFKIKENKLRVTIHLHYYHNEILQKKFWSSVTNIPLSRFYRTYWKPNSGKRKRNNYQGCIAINYYDSEVAKELHAIYNAVVERGVR